MDGAHLPTLKKFDGVHLLLHVHRGAYHILALHDFTIFLDIPERERYRVSSLILTFHQQMDMLIMK